MYDAYSTARRWLHVLAAPLGIGLAVALLPAAASAASPSTWHVGVGTQSPDEAIQGNVYLTREITVDAGDTVDWTIQTGEPHTITFLFGAAEPSPFAPATGTVVSIPSPAPGSPIVNSGLLDQGNTFSAVFDEPGTYNYLCLIHPGMAGTVVVNPASTRYPHPQEFYNVESARESLQILGQGLDLFFRGLIRALEGGPRQVTAGIGAPTNFAGEVWIARFEPDKRIVRKGETVHWTNLDPTTPHTITIGPEPTDVEAVVGSPDVTTAPATTTLSSGFIGLFPGSVGTSFALTFDHVGTYNYYCDLHDELGMKGSIVVVP